MATTTERQEAMLGGGDRDLRQVLDDRRRELMQEVRGRIRDVRADITKDREVLDSGESSEVDNQEDLELALIQMKADTLHTINIALRRLKDATYGICVECGAEIAERRLSVLPFALRCRDCEAARETAAQRERSMPRRGSTSLAAGISS